MRRLDNGEGLHPDYVNWETFWRSGLIYGKNIAGICGMYLLITTTL